MNEKQLKDVADGVVEELELLPALSEFGEARVVGSVALDLVVKPDIDVHLVIDGDVWQTATQVSEHLLSYDEVREVRITDFRSISSLKIGVDAYEAGGETWSIDVWITTDPSTGGAEPTEALLKRLTDEDREIILALKKHYHALGECRDGLSSLIYEAVTERGIETVAAFERWRQIPPETGSR